MYFRVYQTYFDSKELVTGTHSTMQRTKLTNIPFGTSSSGRFHQNFCPNFSHELNEKHMAFGNDRKIFWRVFHQNSTPTLVGEIER